MASKSNTLTVGKSGYALGQHRTEAEWDTLFASKVLPALKGGATMQSQRELYGRSEPIRMACRRAGYASIADAIRGEQGLEPIKVKGVRPTVLVKRITEARESGDSFNTLVLRTGMHKDELTALLRKHGREDLAVGRVITTERGKARAAKVAAEAAAAEAATAKKPRRARKRQVTA